MSAIPLAQKLCSQCGLCCDGSLLADVELQGRKESASMEALGMVVEEEEGRELMLLPCAGLKGTRCQIYSYRPDCYRTFECRLLQELNQGLVSLSAALREVRSAREILSGDSDLRSRDRVFERMLGCR